MESLKATIRSKFPAVAQLSTEQLARWLEEGKKPVVLLDARQPEEYAVSHLPGALLAADETSALRALGETPQDATVVVYCSVGYRSSALAEKLQAQGYEHVFNLEGSIFEWANEGHPVLRNGQPVHQVHPYNPLWGRYLRQDLRSPPDP
jgi:rhodanese-related sulfurtransferase